MLPRTYEDQQCPIARTLEVAGERWTFLILRDAFLGIRRFEDFQARLDISRGVLTSRLATLVEAGLLRREPYQARPVRHDYLLTEKALALWPALVALGEWGGTHAMDGEVPLAFVHRDCGTPVRAVVRCPHCATDVGPEDTDSRPARGLALPDLPEHLATALARTRPLLTDVR